MQHEEYVTKAFCIMNQALPITNQETGRPAPRALLAERSAAGLVGSFPRDRIRFFGPGDVLEFDGQSLEEPMVYATAPALAEPLAPSLIEAARPVAEPDAHGRPPQPLPYWPSYREADPRQRRRYIDWLRRGRRDPDIELGYVFIHFYGLERRILVDDADHRAIAEELIRLMGIYALRSNSFRRYGGSLLWLALFLLADAGGDVPEDLLRRAVVAMPRWEDEPLTRCLACYHRLRRPLPAAIALAVAERNPRSPQSVIIKRHHDLFTHLFAHRYRDTCGGGLILRASKRPATTIYRPASATLERMSEVNRDLVERPMPDVLAITSQIKPLLQLWAEGIEQLRDYDRLHPEPDAAEAEPMTAAMYEALPPELRRGEHPESDAWHALLDAFADDQRRAIVPVSALARIKNLPPRHRLTLEESRALPTTADAIGLAIEPDARLTGERYEWSERVAVFPLGEPPSEDPAPYRAAAAMLRLGFVVAGADGRVEDDELTLIDEHIHGQFDLTDHQARRLDQLRHLLLREGAEIESIRRSVVRALPPAHRRMIGGYLVAVAAVDGIVTDAEEKTLRELLRRLGQDPASLNALLRFHLPALDTAAPNAPRGRWRGTGTGSTRYRS